MRPRVLFAVLVLALVALPASTATGDTGRSTPRAARALAQAKALFAPRAVVRARGPVTAAPPARPRDATLVLRDLALHQDELSAADRRTAHAILARPTAGTPADLSDFEHQYDATARTACQSGRFCVHWIDPADAPDDTDAVPRASSDTGEVPAWVQTNIDVLNHVWDVEVDQLGYHAPLADSGAAEEGGTRDLDVYLEDLPSGLYGYCTSDDPTSRSQRYAYCVLDNDYTEFANGPLVPLEVTAAHEFFHAVQFSYDFNEDLWFMESTAVWMEGVVYPTITDRYQFLREGPLGEPRVPLDLFDQQNYQQYGGWVFFQYLSEHYGRDLVHEAWNRARNTYSLPALRRSLQARHLSFERVFARFGAANRTPARFYAQGAHYPAAPVTRKLWLSARHPATGQQSAKLFHLSNNYVRFTPAASLHGRHRLRIAVDMPDSLRGSAATVMVHLRDGGLTIRPLALNGHGVGSTTTRFGRSEVAFVELALTNTSTRYACDKENYAESCAGLPKDDQLKSVYSARALR